MALTMPHLKYLLAISEAAREYPDVSSRLIADALEVSKPSVVKILNERLNPPAKLGRSEEVVAGMRK